MYVSSSVLLVLSLVSPVSGVPKVTANCRKCAIMMSRPFRECADKCSKAAAKVQLKLTGVDQEPGSLIKETCKANCGNEIDACISLGYCTGTTCDPSEWQLTGTIESPNKDKSIGQFQNAISKSAIATFDYNYGCTGNSPGVDCLGRVIVSEKNGNDNWVTSEEYVGEEKGENFGRYLAMSDDGSVLVIGGYKKWSIKGRKDGRNFGSEYDCDIIPSNPSANDVHTVAVSRNGKYIVLGRSSALHTNDLEVLEYKGDGTISNCSLWAQKGSVYTGGKYDFGYVSIANDGEHIMYGNHDYRIGPNNDGAYMLIHNAGIAGSKGSWRKASNHIPGNGGMQFQNAVEISEDASVVAVGFSLFEINGQNAGRVGVWKFNAALETFEQIGQYLVGVNGSQTGNWLSLNKDGEVLTVSGPVSGPGYTPSTNGIAGVYKKNKTSGNYELLKNQLSGENHGDAFGQAVRLSKDGRKMVCGAGGHDYPFNDGGKIYVYELCGWRR